MTVPNWLNFPLQTSHMVLSSIKMKCVEGTENVKLSFITYAYTFHLWVSYHRFYIYPSWPECDPFWASWTLGISWHWNHSPFLERLFNLLSKPLLGLRTRDSEANLSSLKKSMKGTSISYLRGPLITYIQHQLSWPYLTGISNSLLLCSCDRLWRHKERISESTVGLFILRIPGSDLFYVVWIKIKMGKNLTDSYSHMYLYFITL